VGGKVIGDWWDKQSEETRLRLKNAMESVRIDLQLGLVKGESIGALIGKVRGTPIIPGPFAASKAQAAALARTSTMQVLQATRQEVYNQNADVLKGYQWVSTLDNRTTPLCRGMDGRQYDLNFQPIDGNDFPYPGGPPAHWNCRSTLIPITKSFEELIGSDKLSDEQKNALANIESESVRASMGGPVDSDMSYEEWLRGQPEETQIDILGPARHDLFKRGKITALADLIHQNGRPLNLEQLKKKMEAQ
jgi:SPP1 gp7 family putative phage head morphogenesis protein